MRISIVIPTYNEERYLARTLKSIMRQSLKPDEVIIADYKSKDKTREIAKKFKCRIVDVKRKGIGYGRAKGVEKAKGDIIVLASADAVYDNEWLYNLTRPIIEEKACAAVGSIYVEGPNLIERVGGLILNKCLIPLAFLIGFVFASGDSIAIKRSVYDKVGGIRDMQTGEDTDLIKRVKKICKVVFVENARTFTSNRRIRKWGWLRYAVFHTINFFKVNLLNSSFNKYEAVRE